jgi:hypothetical protein
MPRSATITARYGFDGNVHMANLDLQSLLAAPAFEAAPAVPFALMEPTDSAFFVTSTAQRRTGDWKKWAKPLGSH